jgi:hypothetical protein
MAIGQQSPIRKISFQNSSLSTTQAVIDKWRLSNLSTVTLEGL